MYLCVRLVHSSGKEEVRERRRDNPGTRLSQGGGSNSSVNVSPSGGFSGGETKSNCVTRIPTCSPGDVSSQKAGRQNPKALHDQVSLSLFCTWSHLQERELRTRHQETGCQELRVTVVT